MRFELGMGAFIAAILTGCSASQDVTDPKRITLEAALVDTVDALETVHEKSVRDHTHFGYYGCSITTVFNVSATGTQDNKLALTAASPPNIIPISIGGSASTEATASGTRGNTVTLVLATPYCLPNTKVPTAPGPVIKKAAVAPTAPAAQGAPAVKPVPSTPAAANPNGQSGGLIYPGPVIMEKLRNGAFLLAPQPSK